MKFIRKNILRSFVMHWRANLLILGDLILCALVLFIFLQNYILAQMAHQTYFGEENYAKFYHIDLQSENYRDDEINETSMYRVGLVVARLIQDHQAMKAYGIAINNFVYPSEVFPVLPDEFLLQNNALYEESQDDTGLMGYVLTPEALEINKIEISEGQSFKKEDFTEQPKQLPILLGAAFTSFYDVGDIISVDGDEAKIIGFLRSDATLYLDEGTVSSLEHAIILPQFFPRFDSWSTKEAEKLQTSMIFFGGKIAVSDPKTDVQKEINKITSEYGYYPISVTPLDGSAYTNSSVISQKNNTLLLLLAIVTTTLCLTALCNILYKRTLRDRATICTFFLSGIPLWKVNLSVILEMFFYTALSVLPVITVSIIEYGHLFILPWQITLYISIILFVAIFPVLSVTGKSNLDMLIRDQIE